MSIYKYNLSLSKLCKGLSEDIRLRIIRLLTHGSFHVNEILSVINAKQSNISHHLKILQESGIITNKKEGSQVFYRINDFDETDSISFIVKAIKTEEKNIPYFDDDYKRLELILSKRKKEAEDFFNNVGMDLDNIQDKLFNKIYSTEETLMLFDKKINTIIDIGCGTGRNIPLLSKISEKVIGFDSSPSMLQLTDHFCRKNKINYELKQGDINKIPIPSNSIDGAFMNMVLHHISEPVNALKEISRILKNSGKILLIELLSHQYDYMRERYADLWLGFNKEELYKFFKQSNLTIKKEIIKENEKKVLIDQQNFKVLIILAEKNPDY